MVARPARLLAVVFAAFVLVGCSGSSTKARIVIPRARVFHLADFRPAGAIRPGRAIRLSFVIRQPDGKPLMSYRRGPGPHTGIHLIVVRADLGTLVHHHPPVGADGRISDRLALAPGRYRVIVDAYPQLSGVVPNFQLFRWIVVLGHHPPPPPLPPYRPSVVVSGFRFTIRSHAPLRAIQAASLTITVTDPRGRPAHFTPWFGALAHAIFVRAHSLDYFHTHVCAPGATGCTSILGPKKVTGTSSTPGKLTVGVLVPVAGTWRLFLQCRADGRVLTAPFTLTVR
jgi:hypothetical protein